MEVEINQRSFQHLKADIFFVIRSIIMNYITHFLIVNYPFLLAVNPRWSLCILPLLDYWILFADILDFCIYSLKCYLSVIFCLCYLWWVLFINFMPNKNNLEAILLFLLSEQFRYLKTICSLNFG